MFSHLSVAHVKELPKKTHFDPGQQLSLTAAPTKPPLKRQASPTPLRELIQMLLLTYQIHN